MKTISEALERVHAAASAAFLESAIGDRSHGAARESIDTLGDFVVNHHEMIDDNYGIPIAVRIDMDAVRRAAVDHPLSQAMTTTLEMASDQHLQTCRAGAEDRVLARAIAATATFWHDRGADICAGMGNVPAPDDDLPAFS